MTENIDALWTGGDNLDASNLIRSTPTYTPNYTIPKFQLRMVRDNDAPVAEQILIGSPKAAAKIAAACLDGAIQEHLMVIVLNTDNVLLGTFPVSSGTMVETICDPGDVLTPVLIARGTAFILAHNHPSGNPAPSKADLAQFKTIKIAADTMHRKLVDCIIVGSEGKYYSWAEAFPYEISKGYPQPERRRA